VRKYVLLSTLTSQGLQTLKATPERLLEVNREIEDHGIKVLRQWALLGAYDVLTVVEAPDDAAISRLTVDLAARGSARFDSLPVVDFNGQGPEGS
jgi:uncharacterized protein with GYD domain